MSKADIRRIAAQIKPTSFLDARDYLQAVYLALKAHFVSYSYIRFTEDMGYGSCNAMHLIINGQRPLTLKGAEKISSALGLKGVDRRYFEKLVETHKTSNSGREDAFEKLVELKTRALPRDLDRKQLEFYNEWHHAAILELLSLPHASDDPEWIASKLSPSVTPLKAEKSLKLLKSLQHLVFDKQLKRLVPSAETLSTGNEVFGIAIVRYHQQMIALAKDAITDVAPEDRDISAITIAFPMERLMEIKERIQKFRQELLELSKVTPDADGIVQVNIQMFPLGWTSKGGKRNAN